MSAPSTNAARSAPPAAPSPPDSPRELLRKLDAGLISGLTTLRLPGLGLTELPPSVLTLAPTLTFLDLSSNSISSLPPSFSALTKLKILFASGNKFTTFPAVLGSLPQLEMVAFKENGMSSIPDDALATSLKWLILTGNDLTSLPASIGRCTRLKKFMLAGNKLTSLPASMENLHDLQLLRIPGNEIAEFPEFLLSLPRLSWVAWECNPFCEKSAGAVPSSTPSATHDSRPRDLVDVSWSDLNVGNVLGEGASGIISRATWTPPTSSPQDVAVKVFKGDITSDGSPLSEMAACLAAGKHEHLVNPLGTVVDHPEGKRALTLELLPPNFVNLGGPPSFDTCTRDVYPQGTTFTLRQAVDIALAMSLTEQHLHNRGIMHGDLYAHNILISHDSPSVTKTLLSDFGAATIYGEFCSPAHAEKVQRLEVMAFGWLLEDLLQHLVEGSEGKTVEELWELQRKCVGPVVLERPVFAEVVAALQEIQKSL
ncbi:hypothetical protein MNV49_002033 [Pseudohyphozyma bogoriensis]|nr:hypothetical protein MNV49_002033 [Pseudohyphozyma bogoriensis]